MGKTGGVSVAESKAEEWLRPERLEDLRLMAAECSMAELARAMGISKKTLYAWRKKYPEIRRAIDAGLTETEHIESVERSLYQRATGYTQKVEKMFKRRVIDLDPETGRKIGEHDEMQPYTEEEYFPPDVGAIKFYLTNRAPERWKNKVEYDPDAAKREPELTTAEKLAMLRAMGLTLPGDHNPGPPAHDSGTKGAGPLCETPGDGR